LILPPKIEHTSDFSNFSNWAENQETFWIRPALHVEKFASASSASKKNNGFVGGFLLDPNIVWISPDRF